MPTGNKLVNMKKLKVLVVGQRPRKENEQAKGVIVDLNDELLIIINAFLFYTLTCCYVADDLLLSDYLVITTGVASAGDNVF